MANRKKGVRGAAPGPADPETASAPTLEMTSGGGETLSGEIDELDLDAAAGAVAAADNVLSAEDIAALEAETGTPVLGGVEAEPHPADIAEVSESLEAEESQIPEDLEPEGEPVPSLDIEAVEGATVIVSDLIERDFLVSNGELPDLTFVDNGTGVPFATSNVDPFAVHAGRAAPPPWPFEGDDIPEL